MARGILHASGAGNNEFSHSGGRGKILSPWVAVSDKTWLAGKSPPGSPAAHRPCSASSCLQNSSAWEELRLRHLCLKPTSPKVAGNLTRERSLLQPHCIELGGEKVTPFELLNTSEIKKPTEVYLQETSETFVLRRQGAPHSRSMKYSDRCFPLPKATSLPTYPGSKAGAESTRRPSSMM